MEREILLENWNDKFYAEYCDNDIHKINIAIKMNEEKKQITNNNTIKKKIDKRLKIFLKLKLLYECLKETCSTMETPSSSRDNDSRDVSNNNDYDADDDRTGTETGGGASSSSRKVNKSKKSKKFF
jgi:hypothetical protein